MTPELLFKEAVRFHQAGDLAEAERLYRQVLAADPNGFSARHMLGVIAGQQGRNDEALEWIGAALKLRPDALIALVNYANILGQTGRWEEALAAYDKVLARKPDLADAWVHRGMALHDLKRLDEAVASFDRAIALEPGNAEAHWNRSLCHLLTENFAAGWRDYGWHKKLPRPIEARAYPRACWSGQPLAGKTLFLYCGQGLGDTIQFYRYAPLAAARGARVILAAQDPLQRLLQSGSPDIELIAAEAVPAAFDYHASLIDLPQAFGSDAKTIPAPVPYLQAEPARVQAWAGKIGSGGFRVGVCWQGKDRALMGSRSFPLACFEGLSRLPGIRLISLQKDLEMAPGFPLETLGPDFDACAHAFLDSAAVMENLDLIVTADTSLAHLAGALGRPVWLALKYVPDWRWFLDRSDSPWYPTMRLFRQQKDGDWATVFAEIEAALAGET